MNILRWVIAVAAVLSVIVMPATVTAHVLKSDNGVSAVLHIPPSDSPVSNERTRLVFEMKNEAAATIADTCNCRVAVYEREKKLLDIPLVADGGTRGYADVTFPRPGSYRIELAGGADDSRFLLDYTQYVESSSTQPSNQNTVAGVRVLLIIAGALAILAIIATQQITVRGRYAKQTNYKRRK